MKVDMHSHVLPYGSEMTAGEFGPTFSTGDDGFTMRFGTFERVGNRTVDMTLEAESVGMAKAAEKWYRGLADPEVRLTDMDQKGIDILGVTISPVIYGYFLPVDVGRSHSRKQNEALGRYCDADRSRLFFMATLPMQDPGAAADEIDYAVEQLGAKGVNVAGSLLGEYELDDARLDAVWERIQAQAVPVLIHPSLHSSARDSAFEKWAPILGYPYQATVAFTTLLLGGVLDRFPNLKFAITHGGGFVPYQFGRIERMAPVYGYNRALRPLREYLESFFFDILIHDLVARRFLVDWAGPRQVLVGDNYEGVDSADGFRFLDELALAEPERELISSGNAIDLFQLP